MKMETCGVCGDKGEKEHFNVMYLLLLLIFLFLLLIKSESNMKKVKWGYPKKCSI